MNQRDFRTFVATVSGCLLVLVTGCRDSRDLGGAEQPQPAKDVPDELLPVMGHVTEPTERPPRFSTLGVNAGGVSAVAIEATGERTAADREAEKLSPGVAGWDSEHLSDLASQQLRQFARPVEQIDFDSLLAVDFQTTVLVPENLEAASIGPGLQVLSGNEIPAGGGLASELERLRSRFSGKGELEFRLKPVGIEKLDTAAGFTTDVLVEMAGWHPEEGVAQGNGVWRCEWDDEEPPKLKAIALLNYREVRSSSEALFLDVTQSAFAATESFSVQMMRGIGFWCERLTRVDDMSLTGHHGLAVGDVNGDGLDDVYACDGGGLPNRLYVQKADGTVEDRSAAANADWLEDSRSALIIDLDNDGDQDLVVATIALVLFAENDGAGNFTLKGGHQGAPSPYSMAAADYDDDGDLDIYVTSYGAGRDVSSGAQGFEARSPIPFNDANNGGRNILLANHGSFRFTDVTEEVGLDENNTRWSFAAAWEDYDWDGDADLYVANDFGRNCLYRNNGGTFTDIAAYAGVEDMAGGMSVAWGDHNNDGKMDIYVGNMFSAAGNRVTYQRKFSDSRRSGDAAGIRRMARGNTLFQQGGDGTFEDVSENAAVTMGRWAWSSGFADINNDGREDLVVANGYLTSSKTDDL